MAVSLAGRPASVWSDLASCVHDIVVAVRGFESLTQTGRLRRLRAVAAEALCHFNLSEYRLALQADSFNTVFRVSCGGATYLLRVGPARTIHEVGAAFAEYQWTSALADRGLPVPRIVLTMGGAASVRVAVPGVPDIRECTLLTWRTGRTLTRPLGRDDVADLGALAAEFHSASPVLPNRPAGVLDGRGVRHFQIPDLLDEAPCTNRAVFRAAMLRAQHGLDRLWKYATDTPRLIHSDLTPNNVLRSRGRLAAIDFQDMTWGHLEQDLSNTLFGITRGLDVDSALPTFRSSYEQIRPWPALDPELLADLFAARRLEMVNLALAMNRAGLHDYLERHAAALGSYPD